VDDQPLHVAINAQLVSFGAGYRNAGVSRYTYTLLDGLSHLDSHQRYTAFVGVSQAGTAEAERLSAGGRVRLATAAWPTASAPRRILWEQLALPGELLRLGVRVFHSPVNVLPLRLPCASVVTVHDLAFERFPQHFRPSRRLYQHAFTRRSVRHATRIVAVSENTRRDLIERFGAPEDRVKVIYPAIADDFAPEPDPATRSAFRARHGLPERYILFLGTLEPRKNLTTLLEAYARLRALNPEAPQLVIAGGKGWYYETIFARARTLGLERAITFAGYVVREEQRLWYACAGLFVYPSVYEGFGLPVVEALACGTPVLTSDTASLPEAAGPVGCCVSPEDADALAHAMHGALSDPLARQRTLVEGPRWAHRFSPRMMAQAYAEIYREAAEVAAGQSAAAGKVVTTGGC
jgi:glycosyltransferase involved in cell wall biosynthesis